MVQCLGGCLLYWPNVYILGSVDGVVIGFIFFGGKFCIFGVIKCIFSSVILLYLYVCFV